MLQREAGDRLIGAGVEGPNGHRLAGRPLGEPSVDAILCLLVWQPLVEQELGANQTDPVATGGIQRFYFGGIADVYEDCDRRPVRGDRGPHPERVQGAPRASRRSRARREILAGRRLRIETERRAFAVDQRFGSMGDAAEIEGEADDHGHSARSRESGDMAGGAAARQGDSSPAAPIRGEKTRRRQVFAHEDRARGKATVRRCAGKSPEHPIAHVTQVARTRPEMLVLGRLVLEYLIVQRRSPRAIGGRSDFDRAEGGLPQRLILEHRNLKGKNVGAVAFGSGGEGHELTERGSDRLAQRLRLGRRFAGAARSTSGVQQYGERTGCKADGSYPSAKAKFSHARSRAGLRRDPIRSHGSSAPRERPVRPAPRARRGRWRESAE